MNTLTKPLAALAAAILTVAAATAQAQSIAVPNFSFEGPNQDFFPPAPAIPLVDSWQHADKPGYFTDSDQLAWFQTAGIFKGPAYTNMVGSQAGYILALPLNGIFQDNNTLDWDDVAPPHDFNALFEINKSYKLTIGLYGKSMPDGTTMRLSLYYRDPGNQIVPIQATDAVFSTATFPSAGPFALRDFEVNVGAVQAGDAWAGKNIGIKLEVLNGNGQGYFDVDNVRLNAVPEPVSAGLLGLGFAGLLAARRRTIRRA